MFKTFPQFSKLTLDDKEEYERYIRGFPPVSEFSFVTIMTWWNPLNALAVSRLNDNLVISCWLPGDEVNSGLSLAGTTKVDETISEVFDHLIERGESPKLVHVSEFVISAMRYPENFKLTPERDYDECIVATSGIYPLNNATERLRWKVERFHRRNKGKKIDVRSLDLSRRSNQDLLIYYSKVWPSKGDVNNTTQLEQEMMPLKVRHAKEFNIENICIYIDGELTGFFMYHLPFDSRYAIASYARLNTAVPDIFEFLVYTYAKWFHERGIMYINLDFDMGLPVLRAAKLGLGPMNFFRKYTVEPGQN